MIIGSDDDVELAAVPQVNRHDVAILRAVKLVDARQRQSKRSTCLRLEAEVVFNNRIGERLTHHVLSVALVGSCKVHEHDACRPMVFSEIRDDGGVLRGGIVAIAFCGGDVVTS